MDDSLRTKLIASIEAQQLVVIAGAGLSMSAPSSLPSAKAVANHCFDEHQPISALPTALRDDLGTLAEHFWNAGTFHNLFLRRLVPWGWLNGPWNRGHIAIADFLLCRAIEATLSANFDTMIERWARSHRAHFSGSVDGQGTVEAAKKHSPLLKFHGCMDKPETTVWTTAQLSNPDVGARLEGCKNWMRVHLKGKDLLFVGFWSDWAYLNAIIAAAASELQPNEIVLVDPATPADLVAKAPDLAATIKSGNFKFHHEQTSGDELLDELRREFSIVWIRRLLRAGTTLLTAETGVPVPQALLDPPNLDADGLYDLRRDAEGVPRTQPATKRTPDNNAEQAAFAHLLLRQAGAQPEGAFYRLNGRAVRVVQGGGRVLDTVRSEFHEPGTLPSADIVICAGAINPGVPGNVVRSGQSASVVRPGSASRWLDLTTARGELAI